MLEFPPSTSASIPDLVRRDKIRLAIEHLYSSVFAGYFCGIVLIAFFQSASLQAPWLPFWIAVFLGISLFRLGVIWFLKRLDLNEHAQSAFRLFIADALLAGGSWGIVPIFLISENPIQQAFIAVIIAGVASGGIITRASLKAASRPFLVTITTPMIVVFFAQGTPLGYALGTLSLTFPIVLLIISNQIESQFTDALTLNLEKQELVRNLSLAKETAEVARSQAEMANQELNRAMEVVVAATEAKGRFLANVSHEIRTPMNGVLGMTDILLSSSLTHEQRDLLTTVKGCAESLLVVINDILDFSKIEAGKIEILDREFDPRACFDAVADTLAFQAEKKRLGFSLFIRNDVPSRLRGDPDRMRQILMNLIGNALKFTERGEVCVEVSVRSGGHGPSELLVEIRDTGIGIPPELQSALFQPFSQGDSSSVRRFGGTGLGLVITKNLIELMGGMIGLSSESGQGSTFWFRLPLRAMEPSGESDTDEARRESRSLPKPGKVLIVESFAHQAKTAAEYLAYAGYDSIAVSGFYDALGALKIADTENTGLVLVLIAMRLSQLDGLALAERIRSQQGDSKIPIVLLVDQGTRFEDSLLEVACIAGTVKKPLKRGNLVAMVRRVLGDDAPAETSKPGE